RLSRLSAGGGRVGPACGGRSRTLRCSLTEGDSAGPPSSPRGAGPGRARLAGGPRHSFPDGWGPADVFRDRVLCCFIDVRVGLKLLDEFNLDNVCWESDYPHSDSSWPRAPEVLERLFEPLTVEQVNKITHENAMRHYQFDPYAVRPREKCTVGALRAEAADVDTV